MKKIVCVVLIVMMMSGYPPRAVAVDVENMTTVETISTQSLKRDDVIAPYYITGESLVQLLQKMVDFDVPGSNIIFNRRTAQIFVRNTPSNHDLVAHILTNLRQAEYQQVEIEARIITVSSTDVDDLGLDFLGVDAFGTDGATFFGTDSGFNDGTFNTNIDFPNIETAGGDNLGGQISVDVLGPNIDLDTTIDSLKSRAEVNTLSSPRMLVSNNQRANIRIEKAEYYVQSVEMNAEDVTGDSLAVDPEIGIAQSGTILDVTPTINADGTISLELHPQFVTVDLSNTQTINVSADLDDALQPSVTLPVFSVQHADTTVTIPNGGVALIAGLIEERENKVHYKIPILGDIPFIGPYFFQNHQLQEIKTHLVVFVKGTVRDYRKL